MYLLLLTLYIHTNYVGSITVNRATFTTGDSVLGVSKSDCTKWKGIWNTDDNICYCGAGRSFYSVTNNDMFGCFVGVGSNIGTKFSYIRGALLLYVIQRDS